MAVAQNPANVTKNMTILTDTGRTSYAYFFPPRKDEKTGVETWETSLILNPDAPCIKVIRALEDLLIEEKFGKINEKQRKKLKSPLKDGTALADEDDRYEIYRGKVILVARSKDREVIPHRPIGKDADGNAILEPCTKKNFFSGVWAKLTIKLFAFDKDSNKGVSASLQNAYLVKIDEPLAGKPKSAAADFEGVDMDEFEMVDNSDLLKGSEDDDDDDVNTSF